MPKMPIHPNLSTHVNGPMAAIEYTPGLSLTMRTNAFAACSGCTWMSLAPGRLRSYLRALVAHQIRAAKKNVFTGLSLVVTLPSPSVPVNKVSDTAKI